MPSVCCIVVSFNGAKWIRRCLDSLLQNPFPVKILVIDNASTDDTVQIVRNNYPTVVCIENSKNLGFGQGNNIGLQIAVHEKTDFVFLLNQDAWLAEGTLAALINISRQNPEYGILSPVHMNGAGSDLDTNFAGYLVRSSAEHPKNIIDSLFVNAAAWLITAACLTQTGGFDPIFYHYGEDDHYAQRARYHGFKIGIVPDTYIYHDRNPAEHGSKKTVAKKIHHDWIYFLTQACDINLNSYPMLMIKRGTRYGLLYLASLLQTDGDKKKYYLTMARNIFFYLPKVKNSRNICLHETGPYLNVAKM